MKMNIYRLRIAFSAIEYMKYLLSLLIMIFVSTVSVIAQNDYDIKQAQSYQREAEYYTNQALRYEREVDYYNR